MLVIKNVESPHVATPMPQKSKDTNNEKMKKENEKESVVHILSSGASNLGFPLCCAVSVPSVPLTAFV